jgi:1-acyl-sn-glycerol-3-phosphate acyltransferase
MTHAWMPTSPCGPGCLTGGEPVVGRVRAAGRLARAAGVLLGAVAAAPVLPLLGRRGRQWLVRKVFRALLGAFGVRLTVFGALPQGRGALVVNNHISWLDIVAVNAVRPMRALAKREVRGWPVVGRLAAASGSVFLDRERLRSLPATMTTLATVLRAGSLVSVTPEGTTWCGLASGRFRTAAFQAAIDAGVGVIPVALRFRMGDGRETTAPAFIGEETLLDSIRRVARLRGLVLEVHVLDEVRAGDRRELAALAQAAINAALGRVTVPSQRRRRAAVGKQRHIASRRKDWTSSGLEVAR